MKTPSVLSLSLLFLAASAAAQQPAPASPPGPPAPNVGDVAPDFAFRGVTRFGSLRDPIHVSDFRGETVVLWLFIKARTRG